MNEPPDPVRPYYWRGQLGLSNPGINTAGNVGDVSSNNELGEVLVHLPSVSSAPSLQNASSSGRRIKVKLNVRHRLDLLCSGVGIRGFGGKQTVTTA